MNGHRDVTWPDPRTDLDGFLAAHRAIYGELVMTAPEGEGVTPPPTPPAPPAATSTTTASNGVTLTQEELTARMAREKDQGRNAALTELQNQLGCTLDEAKAILKAHKDQQDAAKSDAEKAREAAEAEKTAAQAEKQAAQLEAHQARVTTAFVLAGITDETKISRYSRLLDVEVGAKAEDVKKAIEKLKTDEPALFGTATPPPNPRQLPGSDPKGTPPAPTQTSDAFAAGVERARNYGKGWGANLPASSTKS